MKLFFFSLLILIFAYLIDLQKKNYNYFLLGLLFAILYLQRSVAMFLIVVPILILLFKFRYKSILKILYLLTPFLIVLLLLGSLNYKRSGIFYFLPTQTVDNLYNYFLPKVDAKIFNITSSESKKKLMNIKDNFAIKNNLDLSKEGDRIVFYNFQKKKAINTMMDNK